MVVVTPGDMFDAAVLVVVTLLAAGTLLVFYFQERAHRARMKKLRDRTK